ncbi:MAG: diadenylate cyclase CdaA [Anaerolineae bacterium]|nr:diadenylate cyclase CdaA [Anaerolineae bacterium]
MLDLSWFLRQLGQSWWNVLDILLVTLIFYWLLYLIRGTQAVQLLRGVVIFALVTVIIANVLPFRAFSWLVGKALPALLVAVPVIFQPELRRALERLGRTGSRIAPLMRDTVSYDEVIEEICKASAQLSDRRDGALIVLELSTGLEEYIETGILLDSRVTAELLATIFFKNTALHDGAVIIRNGRIVAAGCVLPLTSNSLPDRQMGLRHRAAVGVTESTDAIAIVISEETGMISAAQNGRIIRRRDVKSLHNILRATYRPPKPPDLMSVVRGIRQRVESFFER